MFTSCKIPFVIITAICQHECMKMRENPFLLWRKISSSSENGPCSAVKANNYWPNFLLRCCDFNQKNFKIQPKIFINLCHFVLLRYSHFGLLWLYRKANGMLNKKDLLFYSSNSKTQAYNPFCIPNIVPMPHKISKYNRQSNGLPTFSRANNNLTVYPAEYLKQVHRNVGCV